MKRVQAFGSSPWPSRGRLAAAGWRDALTACAVALLTALAAAALLAPIPAGNDQALFVHYGELIRHGAALYGDYWDNKQPGIFGFYALAGALFGDGWPAARLLYALWLGAAAGVTTLVARRVAPDTATWMLVPLLTVGVAMLRTTIGRPAQVESLTALPLAVLLWAIVAEPRSGSGRMLRWVAAGTATGVVASLKLVLAPVAAVLIAVGLGWRLLRRDLTPRAAIVAGAITLAGFALVWLPILGWIAAMGTLAEFRWTMLDYPRLALAHVDPQDPARVVWALRWLAVSVALMVPAGALYAWRALRDPRSREALASAACIAWVVVGLIMFATQRFSWWDTHMDLVTWPFGLLAALGVGAWLKPVSTPGAWRGVAALAVAGVALNVVVHAGRLAHERISDPDWPDARATRDALSLARDLPRRVTAPCGTVFAIGDAAGVERATGLRQALPTHGLWFGAFLPEQTRRLPAELVEARPDLLYVDHDEGRRIAARHPEQSLAIDAWLASSYRPLVDDALGGRWYQRRVEPGEPACPAPTRFRIPETGG